MGEPPAVFPTPCPAWLGDVEQVDRAAFGDQPQTLASGSR